MQQDKEETQTPHARTDGKALLLSCPDEWMLISRVDSFEVEIKFGNIVVNTFGGRTEDNRCIYFDASTDEVSKERASLIAKALERFIVHDLPYLKISQMEKGGEIIISWDPSKAGA